MSGYFLSRISPSDAPDGIGPYWRKVQAFGGFVEAGATYTDVRGDAGAKKGGDYFHTNLNLLAAAVGDDPHDALSGSASLVASKTYHIKHRDTPTATKTEVDVDVQPWAQEVPMRGGGILRGPLPIGPNLAAFLDDPLKIGAPLGLTLPLYDQDASVSQTWLRPPKKLTDLGSAFHGGFDFSVAQEWTEPRRLIDVAAAADGVVQVLLNTKSPGGGVVLRHEVSPAIAFQTIYQHVDPSTVDLAVGEFVRRGQRIGRIRRQQTASGGDKSHLHFGVAVRGDTFTLHGVDVPALWYFIDPFGVYGYHEPDGGSNYLYIPRARGGLQKKIRGAERTIHWAGDPLIQVLPAEIRTGYLAIRQIQTRVRRRAGDTIDGLTKEQDQFLVWLEGIDGFFFAGLGAALDRPIERTFITLLQRAHAERLKVSLGYRFVNGHRQISAAWIQR